MPDDYFSEKVNLRFCRGVLAKTGGRTWFFGGEFVVESWWIVVR
jgi:hypothetical protein